MTAPTNQLPTLEDLNALSKRRQMIYAIRCAQRAEPLYAEKRPDRDRALYIHSRLETALAYLATGTLEKNSTEIQFSSYSDYGIQSVDFAAMAAEDFYNEATDPEYGLEFAEYDEATPAHRVEWAAHFSVLTAYDTHLPLEEARRNERVALSATLADYDLLLSSLGDDLETLGGLWHEEPLDSFERRLSLHKSILRAS